MFEVLSDKLGNVFKWLSNRGRLSEKDVDQALREVRMALLEGDVNFKVVKDFIARIRERTVGTAVLESLTPGQQVIKIVHEELVRIIGGGQSQLLKADQPPSIIIMVGLQGAGKTTTSAKLALHLRKTGQRPLLVACDIYRPAADTQLITLGEQLNIPVYSEMKKSVPDICKGALKHAKELAATVIIVDTAGRLHVDEPLMKELIDVKKSLDPTEVLLVADGMTGQDAVRIAGEFNEKVGLTGLILTKMEGDARGGAALSMKSVTDVPIKFMGVSEKMDGLEVFHPDRLASRILGMGDVLTLIEKAEENFDKQKMEKLEKKMKKASFDLEDFLDQYAQIKKMGSMGQLVGMIPGMSKLKNAQIDEKQMGKIEAIILSMTPFERHNPDIIGGSRRKRIATGSGTTIQDVNQLLNQFRQMQKMIKQLSRGRGILPKLGNIKNMLPFG
ncbi:MAG: signal recognition particle protein [Anaerolineales bacterium]|nr:signal recognition particle protein [Anaerolineales bacterium]